MASNIQYLWITDPLRDDDLGFHLTGSSTVSEVERGACPRCWPSYWAPAAPTPTRLARRPLARAAQVRSDRPSRKVHRPRSACDGQCPGTDFETDRRLTMKPRQTSQAGPARIALGALMLVLLAGCTPTAPSANTSPSTPIQTTATSATSSPSASPIDTTDWTVYESKQYGFSIKHPPGWLVRPAERDWTLEADAGQEGRGGKEMFVTPAARPLRGRVVGAGNRHTGDPGRCRGLGGAVLQAGRQKLQWPGWVRAAVQRDGLRSWPAGDD